MARMRSLRPDYFLREDMADVSLEAHFLLGGLAVLADRDGRLLDRPRTIRAQVFPFREVDVEKALGELIAAGVLARYSVEGKAVLALLTWEQDQQPHPKETSLGLPPPPLDYSLTAAFQTTPQPSRNHGEPARKVDDGSGRVHVGVGLGVGCGSRDGSWMGLGTSAAADATPGGQGTLVQVGEKPKPTRKLPTGPHAEMWQALDAEYLRVMGHAYVSSAAGADGVAVKWLLDTAKAPIPEAVRRWGNLLLASKGGFPTITGFRSLQQLWNTAEATGSKGAKGGRTPAYARAEDSQGAHERAEREGRVGIVDLTQEDPFERRSGT